MSHKVGATNKINPHSGFDEMQDKLFDLFLEIEKLRTIYPDHKFSRVRVGQIGDDFAKNNITIIVEFEKLEPNEQNSSDIRRLG